VKLALGTVQFGLPYGIANQGGQVSLAEAGAMLRRARDSGVDTLDTAISYGESERRLGEIGVRDWQIISKLPATPDGCGDVEKWVADELAGSLQRLKVEGLYGLMLHRPQQLLENNGAKLYRALEQARDHGLVRKIGISIYSPDELNLVRAKYPIDIVQAPFNVMDRRLIATGWLERLASQGTELHVRSIFLQGLLLMGKEERPGKFDRWAPLWSRWDKWLAATKSDPMTVCLQYAMSFPEISKVVVGMDNLAQLDEVLRASVGSLDAVPEDLGAVDTDLIDPSRWASLV
jgi:aryl-alcohol dehydrogenase-like predicted oxidoreductase